MTAGVRDDNGLSLLDLALDKGSKDDYPVGFYLIKHHGCGDEQDKAKVLCKACQGGNLNVVKELVEQHKVDPNGEYISQCHVICCDLCCVNEHKTQWTKICPTSSAVALTVYTVVVMSQYLWLLYS